MKKETQRTTGTILLVIGAAMMALFAAGHVFPRYTGSLLNESRVDTLRGSAAYVQAIDHETNCAVRGPDRNRQFAFGERYSVAESKESFANFHAWVKGDGAFIAGIGEHGLISCDKQVRLSQGWWTHIFLVAQGGLWIWAPMIILAGVGATLRKS